MNIHNSMENIKLKTTKAYGSNGRYSVSNMVNRQELETWRQQNAVHNLEFTVLCEVEFNPQDSFHQIDLLIRQSQVCNDFAELFELGLLSDCKILAGDSTFSCHQAVLAARSPVFRAMFTSNMQEKIQQEATIKDFEPDIVLLMIKYMYSGRVVNLRMHADRHVAAADKYGLVILKAYCEDALKDELTVENCLDFLLLADLYSAATLKDAALKFICRRSEDLVLQDGWQEALKTKPDLLLEMFAAKSKFAADQYVFVESRLRIPG